MVRILVFGDSITYGAWDRKGGWVDRLKEDLHENFLSNQDSYYQVYNLGVSGDTIGEIVKRFEFEAKQRFDENPQIIIFQFGTNSASLDGNKFLISSEKFKEKINCLIESAKKFSSSIVFLGITPVDDSKSNPVSFGKKRYYKIENMKRYNKILENSCKNKGVYFVDIFDSFIKTDYKKLLEDGVHPNSAGHQKIFEIVRNFLIKNKLIK